MACMPVSFKELGNRSGLNLVFVLDVFFHVNSSFAHLADSKFKIV